jgi:selenide,water dikinase
MKTRLTDYAVCAGCAGKLAAGELARVLGEIPRTIDDRVLVDFRTADDAGVYVWPGGPALVQTVDFFAPVVDDPYAYGQIAAANALSDVYAMGGEPRTALAIAAWPKDDGPGRDVLARIVRGGFDKLTEAGVALLGGHTLADREVKFGYAVTGAIDPRRVWTNAGARVGDVLILTKPLGTGIIATAMKFQRAGDYADAAMASMVGLNRAAAAAARQLPAGAVSACTDITGFGLAGHAVEMADASGVTIGVDVSALPVLPGAAELAAANFSGGARTNQEYFSPRVRLEASVPAPLGMLVFDPQTSGGLLLAVQPASATALLSALDQSGVSARQIGRVVERDADGALVQFA